MHDALQKLRVVTRRLSIMAFGLWLAGAGCAFCCVDVAPAVHGDGQQAAARHEADASAPTSCHAHAGRPKPAQAETDTAAPAVTPRHTARDLSGSRCLKPRQPSDPARKLRPLPAPAAHETARDFFTNASHTPAAAPPEVRGHLPDDGHERHVRCCVFLI